MFLWIFVIRVYDASLKRIDDMRVHVLVVPLVLPPVGHVHMAVEEIFGVVFLHQRPEDPESLVGEIAPVIELIGRGMGHQDVKAALLEQLKAQLPDPPLHLPPFLFSSGGFNACCNTSFK